MLGLLERGSRSVGNTPTRGYPQPCDEHEDADRLGRCGRRRCEGMNCVTTLPPRGLPIGGPCGDSYRTCHSRRPSLPRLTFVSGCCEDMHFDQKKTQAFEGVVGRLLPAKCEDCKPLLVEELGAKSQPPRPAAVSVPPRRAGTQAPRPQPPRPAAEDPAAPPRPAELHLSPGPPAPPSRQTCRAQSCG
eukprot:gene17010-biopygen14368